MEPIRVMHFSDVLCIWAYVSQVRIDELEKTFGDQIAIDFHFVPVFGSVAKLRRRWEDRGGLAAYGEHVQKVASGFDHIHVNARVWAENAPQSSTPCHTFLSAVKLLETNRPEHAGALERTAWAMRNAFFRDLADVSSRTVQLELARKLDLPVDTICEYIDSGEAHAVLSEDGDLAKEHSIHVSPTLVFNEGRQILTGNVGYRVIEANVRELLGAPAEQHSWC